MTRLSLRLASLPRVHRWAPIALAAAALAGCTGSDSRSSGTGDVGGTIVISTPGEPGTLVPGLVSSIGDREVTDLLYDRLADIGDDMNTIGDKGFKPQLAERWQWAPDSLSIAFHLNPKARWHDGQPVRASDVRYSFRTFADPKVGATVSSEIANIDSVSTPDSLTAVVWYKRRRLEQFYDFVYQIYIMPEHIFKNVHPDKLRISELTRLGIDTG